MRILLAHFGERCFVRELAPDDIAAFNAARRAGGIQLGEIEITRPVRVRSVIADLAVLSGMLN
jgi:hypothetical protein